MTKYGVTTMAIVRQAFILFLLLGSGALVLAAPAPFPAEFDPATQAADQGRELRSAFAQQDYLKAVGDTDGDGHDDFLFMLDADGDESADTYYLISGSTSTDPLDLKQIQPSDGIELADAVTYQNADVGAAGDVNGDGLADWWAKRDAEQGSELMLIYGRQSGYPSPLLLESVDVGEGVYFMDSQEQGLLMWEIYPVGDFNGDGFDDLAFFTVDDASSQDSWDLRLVYGSGSGMPAVVDVRDLPASQVTTFGPLGAAGGGDVNGDGYDDIVSFRGSQVYVIYGAPEGLPESIDDSVSDGSRGFGLLAEGAGVLQGQVGIAGDLNGDSLDDVYISIGNSYDVDGVYVVYGAQSRQSPLLELEQLSSELGYKVTTESKDTNDIVGALGDINGDGLDDLLLGYAILYGSSVPLNVERVSRLNGVNGFTVTIEDQTVVWPAGDVNGDGLSDFIVDNHVSDVYYLVYGREVDARKPASPNRLKAALAPELIQLRWEPSISPYVVAYEISRDGVMIAQVGSNKNDYEDETAQRDIAYTYGVRVIDQNGRYSAPATIVVQNNRPLYPSLTGEVYSTTLAEIFWSYENVEYNIYRDGVLVDTRFASSYMDRDYTPAGQTYIVEVVDNTQTRVTVRSPTLTLPTNNDGDRPPTTPTGLVADAYSKTAGEVRWVRATDDGGIVRGYEVARDSVVLGEFDALSYVDRDLSPGTTYTYAITAIDNAGQRSGTATVNLTTPGGNDSLDAPENLRAIVYSNTAAELFWTRSTQVALSYEISRNGVLIATVDGTSFFDDNLTGGQTYNYEVVAISQEGQRSAASTVSVQTTGGDTPGTELEPPVGLTALVYSSTAAELFWTRAATVGLRYEISRDGQRIDTIDGTSFFDDNLQSGREYVYEVVAIDSSGNSSAPSSVTLRTNGDQLNTNPFADADPSAATVLARTGYPDIRTPVDDLVSMNYLTLFYDIDAQIRGVLTDRFSDTDITVDCPGGGSATGTAASFKYDFILDRCVIEGRTLTGGINYDADFTVFGLGDSQTETMIFDNLRIESEASGTATFVGQATINDRNIANIECSGAAKTTHAIIAELESVEIETDDEITTISSASWQQSWTIGVERTNSDTSTPCTRTEELSFTGSADVLSSRFVPGVVTRIEKQGEILRDETGINTSASASLAANFNDGSQFGITLLSDSDNEFDGEVQVDLVADNVTASFVENYRFEARQDIPPILGD